MGIAKAMPIHRNNMKPNNKASFGAVAGLAAVILFSASVIFGCSMHDESAPSPPPPTPTTLEGKIKAINDSNMSQANKDIAIGMVKANAARSASGNSNGAAIPPSVPAGGG